MMASGGGRKSCVVCSSSSVQGEGIPTRKGIQIGVECSYRATPCWSNFVSNAAFSLFCGELELCRSYGGYHDNRLFEACKFLHALEKSADVLFVCGECMEVITRMMEKKRKMEDEEFEVWKLQVQILEKMKVLKECTEMYHKEMERIFERVRRAEVDVDTGTKFGKRITMDIAHLIRFREKILDVVTYLGTFREDISRKFPTKTRSNEGPQSQTSLEEGPQRRPVQDRGHLLDESIPSSSPTKHENHSDDEMGADDDNAISDQDFDDNPVVSDHQEETPLVQNSLIKAESVPDDHYEEPDPDLHEESEDEYKPPPPKRRRRKRNSKVNPISNEDSQDMSESQTHKRKVTSQKKKIPSNSTPKSNPFLVAYKASYNASHEKQEAALSQIDFSKMSKLRKYLIEQIVRREVTLSEMKSSNPEGSKTSSTEPYNLETLTDTDTWEYHRSTGKITVSGYEMEVTTDKPNTIEFSCKSCDFHCSKLVPPNKPRRETQRFIEVAQRSAFNHIFRDHLEAFQCKLCEFQGISLQTFQYHLEQHRNPNHFKCDICGKQLKREDSFRKHKLIHMTDQDKLKPCSTCGKIFVCRRDLQLHEETHVSMEERPRVTCPLCGNSMLRKSYKNHKNGYCPAKRTSIAAMCSTCGKQFCSKKYLQLHMKRRHNPENQCEDCGGMRFESREALKSHELTVHGRNDKKLACGKGCGRMFVLQLNQERHEAKCGGKKEPEISEQD